MRSRREDLIVTRWGALYHGRRFPCSIGKGGIRADKCEGDGATPVGRFRLTGGAYRADRLRAPHAAIFELSATGHADIWSDDVRDPAYNHGVRARKYPFSHERMRRGDPLYDLVVVTDYNWPDATPGGGSAIFVHCWKGPRVPTAGCVAFRRRDLIWILERWTIRSRLVIRQA